MDYPLERKLKMASKLMKFHETNRWKPRGLPGRNEIDLLKKKRKKKESGGVLQLALRRVKRVLCN